MKTVTYNFSHGVDAMVDRRMLPDGFAVVMDNVDLRSGYPRPFAAPSTYTPGVPIGTNRIWEFKGKWFYSNLYRTYAAEALPTQTRIYWAEEGAGHTQPQKVVNDVQANLGLFVPIAGPNISSGASSSPASLTLTGSSGGSLSNSTQYGYRVSANTALGTLPACGTVTITLTNTQNAVKLAWTAVPGAISYTVFARTPGKEQVLAANWSSTSYLDDGSKAPSGTYATAFDVTAPYQYLYTFVRRVGSMIDESGPSPITAVVNTGFGRVVNRLIGNDGFFSQPNTTTYSATLTVNFDNSYSQIVGTVAASNGTILTLGSNPTGPWLLGTQIRLTSGSNPAGGVATDLTPGGIGTSWSFPNALAQPAAPTTGAPVAGSGLAAGTYVWAVAAILGSTTVVSGFNPAMSKVSANSGSVTLGSASTVPVAWTPVLNASGYRLFRSADGGTTWAQVKTLSSSVSTYTDNGTNEATGVTPPAVDQTAVRCITIPFNATTYVTPTAAGAPNFWVVLQEALVTLPANQVVANGDAILLAGSPVAKVNNVFSALLFQATAATNANVNVASPASAVFDGFTVSNGKTVLLIGETTGSQNGPWIFNGVGVAMTRPIWYSSGATVTSAGISAVYVTNGNTNAKLQYGITTAGNITVDTTTTAWASQANVGSFYINLYMGTPATTATSMTWTTGNNGIYAWRIYRSGDTTAFLEVAEVPISQGSYLDFTPTTGLGQSLPTSYIQNGLPVTYKPPPKTLRYVELFNGMLFGVDGNTVRWTPIGVPDAWPDAFTINMAYPPTGLASYASGLIILCPDAIYRLDGFDPTQLSLQKTYAEDGCIAPRSIQKTPLGLAYLAKRGIMIFDGNTSRCVTEGKLPYKFLTQPSNYTLGYTAQNFWWYTTDHTQAYAALSYGNNAPIYATNIISPTIESDMPQDGPILAARSFVYRNRYFLYFSGAPDGADYLANTMVCLDLGVAGTPITTLGAKLIDAHVSSLDEAYVLTNYSPPGMTLNISTPINNQILITSNSSTYRALAVTGASGGSYDGPYTYSWSFDDTGTGSGASVTHTWSTSGAHSATVTAVNNTTAQSLSTSVVVNVVTQWIAEVPTFTNPTCQRFGVWAFKTGSNTALIVGADDTNVNGNNCFIYNTSSHGITNGPAIPSSRTSQSSYNACQMSNGNILINGGLGGSKLSFLYSASSASWARVADRNNAIYGGPFGSVQMGNGKVFSAGTDVSVNVHDEIYDPVANNWVNVTSRPAATNNNMPSVCMMSNGKVFLGPGISNSNTSCIAYDPNSSSWSTLTACPFGQAIIVPIVGTSKLLAVAFDATARFSVYDSTANTWTAAAATPFAASQFNCVKALSSGLVIVITPGTKTAYVYNSSLNTWSAYPSVNLNHNNAPIVEFSTTIAVLGSNASGDTGSAHVEYLG